MSNLDNCIEKLKVDNETNKLHVTQLKEIFESIEMTESDIYNKIKYHQDRIEFFKDVMNTVEECHINTIKNLVDMD